MTTVLHAPLGGTIHYDSPAIHSSSYPDLTSIDASMQYTPKTDSKPTFVHAEYDMNYASSAPSSAPSSPTYTHFFRQDSYDSTSASSIGLDHGDSSPKEDEEEEDEDEDEMMFPSYDRSTPYNKPTIVSNVHETKDQDQPEAISVTPPKDVSESKQISSDDQAIEYEPSRHVDYLSHEWREEDIWSSWRYIVARRKKISNSVRLENASWRTWMKAKYNLKTISPETLNWMKDCDVTWLYGPLQPGMSKDLGSCDSQPASRLSTSSSFVHTKPILKKKSASAVILERSRSQQSLLQRAGEIIRVQQASPANGRPIMNRGGANFTLPSYTGSSVVNTPSEHDSSWDSSRRYSSAFPEAPTPSDQKHVLFDEEVRQVQAVESEEDDKVDEPEPAVLESDEDDDGGLIMAPPYARASNRSTPRSSFGAESKTIVPLPSTTLKYRTDTPEPPSQLGPPASFWPSGKKLSPSPSQATLRPSRPSHNYLIDDDPEVSDEPWNASSDIAYSPFEDENESSPRMRKTPSGMFMPYDEDEEEEAYMNKTLFGQAINVFNTVKDIGHVVFNVGWGNNR